MYLIDTNVISEARKGSRAHPGVRAFLGEMGNEQPPMFLTTTPLLSCAELLI
jgi:toxin FitB